MHCVPFLPKKLGGSQKEPRTHFPTDYVCPLIDQDGQVAVGLNPFGVSCTNNGFAGRSNDKRFF